MALINCPECGGQVSDEALACPHCGKQLRMVSMPQQSVPMPQQSAPIQSGGVVNAATTTKRPVSILVLAIIALILGVMFSTGQVNTDNSTNTGVGLVLEGAFVAAVAMMDKAQIPAAIAAILAIVSYGMRNKVVAIIGIIVAVVSLLAVLYFGISNSGLGLLFVMPLYLPAPILAIIANAIATKRFGAQASQI